MLIPKVYYYSKNTTMQTKFINGVNQLDNANKCKHLNKLNI